MANMGYMIQEPIPPAGILLKLLRPLGPVGTAAHAESPPHAQTIPGAFTRTPDALHMRGGARASGGASHFRIFLTVLHSAGRAWYS